MQVFLIEYKKEIKFFKKFTIEDDKIILYSKIDRMNIKQKTKVVDKIVKILNRNNSTKVILSKKLKQNKDFLNLLYSSNIDIIKGRSLFKMLIYDILQNIVNKYNLEKEKIQLSICVNDLTPWIEKIIRNLSEKYKIIYVVTNNIHSFDKIKERMYEENGIILNVTDNKRKALIKSKLVLNVDFTNELINKYSICDDGIIINIEEPIKIKKKRFNGVIINDFDIMLKTDSKIYSDLIQEKYENFELKDLVECFVTNYPEEIKNIDIVKLK